ncbi:MAG: septum site-determining protein MinC [Candidatus Obscuribacterales bacterium]
MSKIAIISQPNEGVLLDVSGCSDLKEALEYLSSTLQASNSFWSGLNVSINVGKLSLKPSEVAQILAIAKGVGISPAEVYTTNSDTISSLEDNGVSLGRGAPMALPEVSLNTSSIEAAESDEPEEGKIESAVSSIKVRVRDALQAKRAADSGARIDGDDEDDLLQEHLEGVDLATEDIRQNEKRIRKTIVKRKIHITGEFPAAEAAETAKAVKVMDEEEEEIEEAGEEEIELDTETVETEEDEQEEDLETEESRLARNTTMYLRQTLRSGQTISHKGHLIIVGDVNPGAEVMAEGDITIWGSLRGIAHAGIGGNTDAEIRALNLQPIQIRIAHAIARAPDKPRWKYKASHGPETARLVADKIRVFRSRIE